jgi:FdhD protein
MILYAEDLGRHNTLDRIAGEALFKGVSLEGLMLVTSGRISTEMAAKAAQLGIALLASRTSPTDMAVRLCQESGITLIGYLRAGRFQVYSHPERIELPPPKLDGVTAAILAGGKSSRMGRNKALLDYHGAPLIATVYRALARIFSNIVVVTNSPEDYPFLPCPKIPDIYPGSGSLAGVHAALAWSATERVFVVACDMPHLDETLIRRLVEMSAGQAAVVPESSSGLEPLHAVYSRAVLPDFEAALQSGRVKIVDLLAAVGTKVVPAAEVAGMNSGFTSFDNLNTPEDCSRLLE